MNKLLLLKLIHNKKNKQLNISLPKKKMPKKFLDMLKQNPDTKRMLKIKIEDFI